eukprot:IDg4718t1
MELIAPRLRAAALYADCRGQGATGPPRDSSRPVICRAARGTVAVCFRYRRWYGGWRCNCMHPYCRSQLPALFKRQLGLTEFCVVSVAIFSRGVLLCVFWVSLWSCPWPSRCRAVFGVPISSVRCCCTLVAWDWQFCRLSYWLLFCGGLPRSCCWRSCTFYMKKLVVVRTFRFRPLVAVRGVVAVVSGDLPPVLVAGGFLCFRRRAAGAAAGVAAGAGSTVSDAGGSSAPFCAVAGAGGEVGGEGVLSCSSTLVALAALSRPHKDRLCCLALGLGWGFARVWYLRLPSPGMTNSGALSAQELGSGRLFPGQYANSSPMHDIAEALDSSKASPVRFGDEDRHVWLGEDESASHAASLGSELYDSASDSDGD